MSNYRMLINGELLAGKSSMAVINPANEEEFARCPVADENELNAAVSAAKKAFPEWSAKSYPQRQACLVAIADTLKANAEELLLNEPKEDIAEEPSGYTREDGSAIGYAYCLTR